MALLAACEPNRSPTYSPAQLATIQVLTPDQVSYQPLNPARGPASPQAAVLWGDILQDVSSGVLLRFAKGFSSPPHIHNITYRAIVISGKIHNDDPDAANLWMGPGSFWTQPAGEIHITSARPGLGGTAFIEILAGPYLVQPGDQAFDNGEQPLNLLASNLVWMSANEFQWIDANAVGANVATLWGNPKPGSLAGFMLTVPSGFEGSLWSQFDDIKAVVIKGVFAHSVKPHTPVKTLKTGGYFASANDTQHSISCSSESECQLYIRTAGRFRVNE
ncbi:MAG: DUF4437 domain-containing protein [Pseudomonadota bacterium]